MKTSPIKNILERVRVFQESKFLELKKHFQKLEKQQNPEILWITCSDSRIDPHLITQSQPGTLFITRNIGNMVPPFDSQDPYMGGVLEFAIHALGIKHIIICGHSDCGAMKAIKDETIFSQNFNSVSRWLNSIHQKLKNHKNLIHSLDELIYQNVSLQIDHLRTYPILKDKNVEIYGWVYNIGNGTIEDYQTRKNIVI